MLTQLQISLSTVHFLIKFLTQIWVCPYSHNPAFFFRVYDIKLLNGSEYE